MFLFKLEGPTTIIVFENLKFPKKNGNHLYIIGLRSGPLRADLMLAYSLGKLFLYLNSNCTLLEVACVGYQPLLGWIHSDNYNQRVLKPLILAKAVGKGRTNT